MKEEEVFAIIAEAMATPSTAVIRASQKSCGYEFTGYNPMQIPASHINPPFLSTSPASPSPLLHHSLNHPITSHPNPLHIAPLVTALTTSELAIVVANEGSKADIIERIVHDNGLTSTRVICQAMHSYLCM